VRAFEKIEAAAVPMIRQVPVEYSDRMPINTTLANLVAELEQDHSLREPQHLRERFEALDELDAFPPDGPSGQPIEPALHQRSTAIRVQLESVNCKLYESIRRDIQRGSGAVSLLEWMHNGNFAANLRHSKGYDYLDDLVSGVLQLEEPLAQVTRLESEMVPYQPTPARHIFDFIRRTELTQRDVLIDLGSGLGQVTLLASICSSANCTGIELEPSYVDCARKSGQSLNLINTRFVQGDARAAGFSTGTVFYLYTPFFGSILRDVLDSLRNEAVKRVIRICTFGPCTRIVAEEKWLNAIGAFDTERICIFRSRN